MNSRVKLDHDHLLIFHEGRKRRVFVAELIYNKKADRYELFYDKKYVRSKRAIPIGPELDIFTIHHVSEKGELFSSFIDRIPLKTNPAYKDYCKSQGISSSEENNIILLGFIGKRGPSSFVFEPVYKNDFSILDLIKFRTKLGITQHDFAEAFDIKELTLQKLEAGKSKDENTLKRLQVYLEFPEVALWQLKKTGGRVHSNALLKLKQYFKSKTVANSS